MHHKHGSGYFLLLHFAIQIRAYGSLSGERKTSELTCSVDGRSSRVEKKKGFQNIRLRDVVSVA